MNVDLEAVADAAIACALRKDADGYAQLVRDLDADQMRAVAWSVAEYTATSMIERVEDAGLAKPRKLALELWQGVMLRRAAKGAAS